MEDVLINMLRIFMVEILIFMEKFDIKKNCVKFINFIKSMYKYNICV